MRYKKVSSMCLYQRRAVASAKQSGKVLSSSDSIRLRDMAFLHRSRLLPSRTLPREGRMAGFNYPWTRHIL